MKKYLWILLAALSAFALLTAACGGDDATADDSGDDDATVTATTAPTAVATATAMTDMDVPDNAITLVPRDSLRFEPNVLQAKVGEIVQVTLDNTAGVTLHDFTVRVMPVEDVHVEGSEHSDMDMDMERAIHVAADAGTKGVVTFTPTEPGTYEFECSAADGTHKAAGMTGTFVVS